MFNWLWKRGTKVPAQEIQAYKLGQNAAQGLAADLDSFMRTSGCSETALGGPSTVPRHRPSYSQELTAAGLQMFLDMVDRLKVADDRWRAANPEKAARFPPD
jgi:hypothetical protein